ncbi:MAG TPA: hypothetical protein EYH42_02240 [Sulfurovum sp.]|nr:hypothetical protein [Sulfurovum sp.]
MELYSDSNRKLEKNDICIYDEVSEKFKNDFFYFIKDNIDATKFVEIYQRITMEHGLNRNIKDTASNIILLVGIYNESI